MEDVPGRQETPGATVKQAGVGQATRRRSQKGLFRTVSLAAQSRWEEEEEEPR